MINTTGIIIIIGVFIGYFAFHSLLASLMMKRWLAKSLPALMPYYRLMFNIIAMVMLLPLVFVMFIYPGESLWQWQGFGFYLSSGLALLAVVGFIYSLKFYDLSEFSGSRQIRERNNRVEDQEHFKISPLHRYVRHPWYFFALVLIWTRDVSTTQLVVYLLLTGYFVFGSILEERKLLAYHGEVYQRYQQKVAGIIPLPWRVLSKDDAAKLIQQSLAVVPS